MNIEAYTEISKDASKLIIKYRKDFDGKSFIQLTKYKAWRHLSEGTKANIELAEMVKREFIEQSKGFGRKVELNMKRKKDVRLSTMIDVFIKKESGVILND